MVTIAEQWGQLMPEETQATEYHKRRVMLVDDNQAFLAVAREFLEELDEVEVVEIVSSSEDALAAVERVQPDILVIDFEMPGLTGIDVTRQLRERGITAKVLVLTLFDTPQHRGAALDAGADAFVGKSRMDVDLIPTIQSLISQNGMGSTPHS